MAVAAVAPALPPRQAAATLKPCGATAAAAEVEVERVVAQLIGAAARPCLIVLVAPLREAAAAAAAGAVGAALPVQLALVARAPGGAQVQWLPPKPFAGTWHLYEQKSATGICSLLQGHSQGKGAADLYYRSPSAS